MDRDLRIRMLLEASDRVTRPLRDMAGGASRAAQALSATRDRLKGLNAAQADIAGFRQLKSGLKTTEGELAAARDRVGALARQIAQTDAPTKRLTNDFAKAQREAARLKTEHGEQAEHLQTLRSRLREAGVDTGNLAGHERRLRGDIAATNNELQEQSRRLQQAADRADRLRKANASAGRIQNAATGFAAGGFSAIQTGETIGRPITGAIDQAMQFQSVMTDIAQKADLGRNQAARMGQGLLQAARAANQMPDALQQGVDTLAGFGLDPRKAVQAMAPIGRAATTYKASIADLSAASYAAIDNLKVPVDQTGQALDAMAQAGKSGAFELKDMAQFFPTLTAGYQALGQHGVAAVGDLAAALQIARKGAGDSASAATNVANLIQKMASPETIRNFKKFGVDLPAALKRAYAEGKTPIEAITELTQKTLHGDLSRVGFLFNDAQVQQALRPLIQNLDEYRRIRKQALGAHGVVDHDFAEQLQDGAERTKRFKIQMQILGVTFGTMLLPVAKRVLDIASGLADRFSAWAQKNPGFAKGLAITAAILAGLFIVLGGGAIAIAGVLAPFAALAWTAGALNLALLPVIGTVLAVVAAVALVGAAAYLIYNNWGAIGAWFAGLWAGVRGGAVGIFNWFTGLPGRFVTIGGQLMHGLINGITGALGWVKNSIVGAANSVVDWFKARLGIHSPSRVFSGLGGFLMAGLANGIDGGAGAPVQRIDRLSRRLTGAMALGGAAAAFAMPATAASLQRAATLAREGSAAIAAGAATPRVADPAVPADSRSARQVPTVAPPAPPITIHVHAAPGQSERQLADFVAKKVAEVMRRHGAGRQGSFLDAPDLGDLP